MQLLTLDASLLPRKPSRLFGWRPWLLDIMQVKFPAFSHANK